MTFRDGRQKLFALDVVEGIGVDTQALRHACSISPARVTVMFTLSPDERSEPSHGGFFALS